MPCVCVAVAMQNIIVTVPSLRDCTTDVTVGTEIMLHYAMLCESLGQSMRIEGVEMFDIDTGAVRHREPGVSWFR